MMNLNEVTLLIGVVAMLVFAWRQEELSEEKLHPLEKAISFVLILAAARLGGLNMIALMIITLIVAIVETLNAGFENENRPTALALAWVSLALWAVFILRLVLTRKGFALGLSGKNVINDTFFLAAVIGQIVAAVRLRRNRIPREEDDEDEEEPKRKKDHSGIIVGAIVVGCLIIAVAIAAAFYAKIAAIEIPKAPAL